nr:hypothetical protein [Gemmatimonadaceae bacterium]
MHPFVITLAATLEERRRHPGGGTPDPDRAQRWQRFVARGDEVRWRRRLGFDGIDPTAAAALMGTGAAAAPGADDAWFAVLGAALADGVRHAGLAGLPVDRATAAREALPFQDILLPFIRTARLGLAARCQAHLPAFTGFALAQME